MTPGERYPGAGLRRAWPLAVSLAVHVVLLLLWLHFGGRVQVTDDTPQALSVLLLPRPAQPPAPAIEPSTREPEPEKHSTRKPAAIAPETTQSTPPTPESAAPVPAVPAPAAVATVPGPTALDILNAAKQQVRKGEAAPRASKGAALQASGKWSRFESLMAEARTDKSPGPVTEMYTAPDGQVFYRTRVNGKVTCRKSGSTGPPAPWRSEGAIAAGAGREATLGVANSAGDTLCPDTDPGFIRR